MRCWREAIAFATASLDSTEAGRPGGRASDVGVEGAAVSEGVEAMGVDGAAFPVAVLFPPD